MARNGNAKTRRFALNMLKVSVAISGAALLFACGDDDSSFGTSAKGGSAAEADIVVATFDYLPNCTDNREGKTAFVKEENATYVCTDGEWVVVGETGDEGDDDGEKSSSSTAKSADSKDKSSSSDGNDDGKSSSSSKAKSSSSDKDVSSSSVTLSSSSSVTLSEVEGSSSSSVIASSSSEELVSSSSFNKSSSSSRGLFEMSKDEFLNPKISYGEVIDERDGQKYKTVEICNKDKSVCQTWMAENLNYDYNKGTAKSFCYGGIEANCAVTGRLYTWAAAIDSVALANDADNPQICGYGVECTLPTVVQGVCPDGWHLPTYNEWKTLINAVGGSSKAGPALKSGSGWYGNGNGEDAYGFSALPAGYRDYDYYDDAGDVAFFWSAFQIEYNSDIAYIVDLYYGSEGAHLDNDTKNYGLSVRCLQN